MKQDKVDEKVYVTSPCEHRGTPLLIFLLVTLMTILGGVWGYALRIWLERGC